MTDWRNMEAGDGIERIIAEMVGWTNIREAFSFSDSPDFGYYEYSRLEGISPETDAPAYVPAYSRDLNDAFRIIPYNQHFELIRREGAWMAVIHQRYVGEASTPALAIVRARLEREEQLR